MNHVMIFELARIRQQELLDEAAQFRRADSYRPDRELPRRPGVDHLFGVMRSLLALLAP